MSDIVKQIESGNNLLTEKIQKMLPEQISGYFDDSQVILRHPTEIPVYFNTAIGTIHINMGIEVVYRDDPNRRPLIRLIKAEPFTVVELCLAIALDITEMQRLNHCRNDKDKNQVDFENIVLDYVTISDNRLQIHYIWKNAKCEEIFWRGFMGYEHNIRKDEDERRAIRYWVNGMQPELYF